MSVPRQNEVKHCNIQLVSINAILCHWGLSGTRVKSLMHNHEKHVLVWSYLSQISLHFLTLKDISFVFFAKIEVQIQL